MQKAREATLFARNRWRLSTDRRRWQQFPLFSLPRKRPSVPLRCRLGALNPASRKNIFQNFGLVIRRMFCRGPCVMIGSCSWAGGDYLCCHLWGDRTPVKKMLITTAVRNINSWVCISVLRQSFPFPTTPRILAPNYFEVQARTPQVNQSVMHTMKARVNPQTTILSV